MGTPRPRSARMGTEPIGASGSGKTGWRFSVSHGSSKYVIRTEQLEQAREKESFEPYQPQKQIVLGTDRVTTSEIFFPPTCPNDYTIF